MRRRIGLGHSGLGWPVQWMESGNRPKRGAGGTDIWANVSTHYAWKKDGEPRSFSKQVAKPPPSYCSWQQIAEHVENMKDPSTLIRIGSNTLLFTTTIPLAWCLARCLAGFRDPIRSFKPEAKRKRISHKRMLC